MLEVKAFSIVYFAVLAMRGLVLHTLMHYKGVVNYPKSVVMRSSVFDRQVPKSKRPMSVMSQKTIV